MRAFVLACILTVAVATTPFTPAKELRHGDAAIMWAKCWFERKTDWPSASCGVLIVPQNRARPSGVKVALPFIIFKALEPSKNSAPVLVAGGGGPGSPLGVGPEEPEGIGDWLWNRHYHMSVNSGRELILLDNRGVGSSRPRLDCPEVESRTVTLLSKTTTNEEYVSQIADAYAACRRRLVAQGIELSAYNNLAAARDIEDLRLVLGIEQLNVHGISYGTRVAMAYAREYPQSTRALVLDGLDPPHINYYEVFPEENYRSIKHVFELCREDFSCRNRFGEDLYQRFVSFLERLEDKPIALELSDPRTLQPTRVWLTPEILVSTLFSASSDERKIGQIPLAVATLLNGSLDYITNLVREEYVKAVTENSDEGAYASYSCHDEVPFNDLEAALDSAAQYPIQRYMNPLAIELDRAMCKVWDVQKGGRVERLPLRSDVPTLIFSGVYDPLTPPAWARSAATYLPNVWVKDWDGIAHDVLSVSVCADWVADRFLAEPHKDPFVFECVDATNPIVFDRN
jgi:pimeloyl-ACP methyl ester carboxylesterase